MLASIRHWRRNHLPQLWSTECDMRRSGHTDVLLLGGGVVSGRSIHFHIVHVRDIFEVNTSEQYNDIEIEFFEWPVFVVVAVDIYWVDSVRPFTTSAYTKMPRDYKRIPRHVIISHFHFYSVKCIFLAHGLRRTIDTMPMKVAAVVMQPMQLTAFIATKMWKLCSHIFPSSRYWHCSRLCRGILPPTFLLVKPSSYSWCPNGI